MSKGISLLLVIESLWLNWAYEHVNLQKWSGLDHAAPYLDIQTLVVERMNRVYCKFAHFNIMGFIFHSLGFDFTVNKAKIFKNFFLNHKISIYR